MDHNKFFISIQFFDTNPIVIGIDTTYQFSMKLADDSILKINDDTAVNLLRLLELDYAIFEKDITEMIFKLSAKKENFKDPGKFPCTMIVKAALKSERDYWIQLSIPWLKVLGKSHFTKELKAIQNNSHVGQKVKHLLMKL